MRAQTIKLIALVLFAFPILFVTLYGMTPPVDPGAAVVEEPAATYKAKCAMCHSPKAEKFFDLAKENDYHVEVILKGKKGEKPPHMPAFETKNISADDAKALVEYMRGLRTPAN